MVIAGIAALCILALLLIAGIFCLFSDTNDKTRCFMDADLNPVDLDTYNRINL